MTQLTHAAAATLALVVARGVDAGWRAREAGVFIPLPA